mgnify:CR=1 FL=1
MSEIEALLVDRDRLLEEIYQLRAENAELKRAVALGHDMVACMEANP